MAECRRCEVGVPRVPIVDRWRHVEDDEVFTCWSGGGDTPSRSIHDLEAAVEQMKEEIERLRAALERLLRTILRSRKVSIGGLKNTYCCQLDVAWIEDVAKALKAPAAGGEA